MLQFMPAAASWRGGLVRCQPVPTPHPLRPSPRTRFPADRVAPVGLRGNLVLQRILHRWLELHSLRRHVGGVQP
jgi:hypothetical protein